MKVRITTSVIMDVRDFSIEDVQKMVEEKDRSISTAFDEIYRDFASTTFGLDNLSVEKI